jgi:Zn-dependent peptidase ImmA (M78 family)/transcriptional regulator with XRE-family HTH domain
MVNMSRLELARKRRGLTKKDLAHNLNVTDRTISNWYNQSDIDIKFLEKISEILNFPKEFFLEDTDLNLPNTETVSFRALSKISSRKRDIALSQTVIAEIINKWLDTKFDLPTPFIPDLHELRDNSTICPDVAMPEEYSEVLLTYAQTCAEVVRKTWGLGEKPISNIISLLESKGIRVFSLSDEAQEVDACCQWINDRPFIFLNIAKSSERCRFDAAHELGHLVMHRHGIIEGRQMEQEANAFASAFLMPKKSILADPISSLTLKTIIVKKKYWKVSAAALTYRYRQLNLITDWNAITIYKKLSELGRTIEPESIPHERSLLLSKVLNILKAEGLRPSDIAHQLKISFDDFNALTFGIPQELTDEMTELRRSKLKLVI